MADNDFHSTFAQICVTILAVLLAFYGILGVNLAEHAQLSHQDIVRELGQVDEAIRAFCDITEPPLRSWSNWTIPSDREYNVYMLMQKETWNSSPVEVLNSTVTSVINNFTDAEQQDNKVRDWLQNMNISRFFAHYLLVEFSLHELKLRLYREFPPPPAQYSGRYLTKFVNQSFPEGEAIFQAWADLYRLYFAGITQVYSQLDSALKGISEAYMDSARMDNQTLTLLINENITDAWTVKSFEEDAQYNVAMSSYYTSLFDSLYNIYSQMTYTQASMERYHRVYNLAFSDIWTPVALMAFFGVAMPMALLGASARIDAYIKNDEKGWKHLWRQLYVMIVIISVILFIVGLLWTTNVLWRQISELYLS